MFMVGSKTSLQLEICES